MSTNDTERALLAAIIAHPDDDTPRLVYADFLDEQDDTRKTCPNCKGRVFIPGNDHFSGMDCLVCVGTGTVVDTANRDRADFIRVQCEVGAELKSYNNWSPESLDMICDPDDGEEQLWKHRVQGMHRRAESLLAVHRSRWLREPCPKCENGRVWPDPRGESERCPACDGSGDIGELTVKMKLSHAEGGDDSYTYRYPVTFQRGFPFAVGNVRLEDAFTHLVDDSHDEWFPTAWILRVFTHHPTLQRVPLVDKQPDNNDENCQWYLDNGHHFNTQLPLIVFKRFPGYTPYANEVIFDTAEHAANVLATAVADVVRKAVEEQ